MKPATAKGVGTTIALFTIVATAVAMHTTAYNQITANEVDIVKFDDRLARIERLLVRIAQNDGIDVSELFDQ